MEGLSEHDTAVLDVIFDPLQLLGTNNFTSEKTDGDRANIESQTDQGLPDDVVEIVALAIKASAEGRYEESLRLFDTAKSRVPLSPVILNDRAQALRLLRRDNDALEDLNLSLELSKGEGKAGVQALCQRGILHRTAGRLDDAKIDFEVAARAGSSFARAQLVNLNPYAAMCNAMLRDLSHKSANVNK